MAGPFHIPTSLTLADTVFRGPTPRPLAAGRNVGAGHIRDPARSA
jgi:hypothetical protein